MTPECGLGFDASDVSDALDGALDADGDRAFRAHLPECDACKSAVRVVTRARGAWRTEVARDDAHRAPARERRLASASGVRRAQRRPWAAFALAAAAGAAAVAWWVSAQRTSLPIDPPVVGAPASTTAAANVRSTGAGTASPAPEVVAKIASASVALPAKAGLVVGARACETCGGPPVAAGVAVEGGELTVPRGAALMLSWSLGEGLVDPAASVDVQGPASVRADGPVVFLAYGAARAVASGTREIHSALARTRGASAAWQLEAGADRTRVHATTGEISVEGTGARREVRRLRAGETVDVLPDGRIVDPNAAPAPSVSAAPIESAAPAPSAPPSEDALWRAAQDALKRGDRAAAEAALITMLASSRDPSLRERGALVLGQLLLARGDRSAARVHLAHALRSRTPAVAADAALLLARAASSARERADVWAAHLGTAPPSPYREQAILERASALLDAGDADGARALATGLRASGALPAVVSQGLERLESRLASP